MESIYHRGVPHLGLQENVLTLQFHHSLLQPLNFPNSLIDPTMAVLIRVCQLAKGLVKPFEVLEASLHLFLTSQSK